MKRLLVLVALVATVAVGVVATAGDAARTPQIRVVQRTGSIQVAPNTIDEATLLCPRGYVATGGTVSPAGPGGIVGDLPARRGVGWTIIVGNLEMETQEFFASVVCARGRGVRVTAARHHDVRRQVERAMERYRE
jgi:hypothetical protein